MNTTIRQILEEMRSGKSECNTDQLAERLSKADPKPIASELWLLCSQLAEKPAGEPAKKPNDPFNLFNDSTGSIFEQVFGGHGLQQPLPTIVTDFATDYLTSLKPKRLLNPWTEEPVGVSALLNALPSLQEACAVASNAKSVWQAQLFGQMAVRILGWSKVPEWRVGKETEKPSGARQGIFATGGRFEPNPVRTLAELKGEWDAIICFPPMGANDKTWILVTESASKLSSIGAGLFVVPLGFFPSAPQVDAYNCLGNCGLAVEAVLSIPREYRGELSGVDLSLITVRRGIQGPLFVGELQADCWMP